MVGKNKDFAVEEINLLMKKYNSDKSNIELLFEIAEKKFDAMNYEGALIDVKDYNILNPSSKAHHLISQK